MGDDSDVQASVAEAEPFVILNMANYLTVAQKLKAVDLPHSAMTHNSLLIHARGAANTSSFYVLKNPPPHSTAVLTLDHVDRAICVHCCKSEVDRMKEALKKTSVIDWHDHLVFRFVPDYLTEAVQEVVREKQVQDLDIRKFHIFVYEPRDEELPLRCSKGLKVCRLGKAGVHQMAESWGQHRGKFPLEHMLQLVVSLPSAAVYLNPSSESDSTVNMDDIAFAEENELPICWVSTTLYGALGLLMTKPEHRGRGLARLVVQVLARQQQANGYVPYCYTRPETAGFFERIGGWCKAGSAAVMIQPYPL